MDEIIVQTLFQGLLSKFSSLYELENAMKKLPQEVHENGELEHIFSGGVYIRQLIMPKDTIAIGKRHRYETCNILMKGEASVYMADDIPCKRVKAPFLFTSPPLIKKFVYFHEDSIFCNLHPTKETDLEKIEKEFIISEKEYLEKFRNMEEEKQ